MRCRCGILSVSTGDMPASIRMNYQYFTAAPMTKLRDAVYHHAFSSLEEGVADYVLQYLIKQDIYR